MAGANSPAGLASKPIKILLADEVDRFPKAPVQKAARSAWLQNV